MKNFNRLLRVLSDSCGGILPLLAIMMIPLLCILGLAIDGSLMASARSELAVKANQGALAAAAHYISFIQSSTPAQPGQPAPPVVAFEQAALRAQQITGINITIGERFASNSSDAIDLGTVDQELPQSGAAKVEDEEGTMEVGRYFWVLPCPDGATGGQCVNASVVNSDACGTSPDAYPCFKVGNINSATNNAIRLTLKFKQGNPLRTVFMRFFGIGSITMSAQSVATLVPRNDYFLIDLSRSTYWDTYLPVGTKRAAENPGTNCTTAWLDGPKWFGRRACSNPGSRSEFVYQINGDQTGNSQLEDLKLACEKNPSVFAAADLDLICPNVSSCLLPGTPNNPVNPDSPNSDTNHFSDINDWGIVSSDNTGMFKNEAALQPVLDNAGLTLQPWNRFRDDFRCRRISGMYGDPNDSSGDQYVAVDYQAAVGSSPSYYFAKSPPQPLFDILSSAHAGMELLKERNFASDKLGILGFDETFFIPSQGQNPSSRHLPLSFIDVTPSSRFTTFLNATDISKASDPNNSNLLSEDFISRGLFPMPQKSSDLHRALQIALGEIASPNNPSYQLSKNSIFLFTDGQANCLWSTNYDSATGESQFQPVPVSEDGSHCKDNGMTVVSSLVEIGNSEPGGLVDLLKRRRISVSIALLGGGSGAHYVARKSAFGPKCMDQTEANELPQAKSFVSTNMIFHDESVSFPYGSMTSDPDGIEELNLAKRQSVADDGAPFYAPNALYDLIVKPTKGLWIPILPTLPGNVDFSEELDAQCANLTYAGGALMSGAALGTVGGSEFQAGNFQINGIQVVDDFGRVLYDPKGRSAAQQLKDGLTQVLSSPFVLAPNGN